MLFGLRLVVSGSLFFSLVFKENYEEKTELPQTTEKFRYCLFFTLNKEPVHYAETENCVEPRKKILDFNYLKEIAFQMVDLTSNFTNYMDYACGMHTQKEFWHKNEIDKHKADTVEHLRELVETGGRTGWSGSDTQSEVKLGKLGFNLWKWGRWAITAIIAHPHLY